jgi:hypothetical protein
LRVWLGRALLVLGVGKRALHGSAEEQELASERADSLLGQRVLEVVEHGSEPAYDLKLRRAEGSDLVDRETHEPSQRATSTWSRICPPASRCSPM